MTPKLGLLHRKKNIFANYTPWETLEFFGSLYLDFPYIITKQAFFLLEKCNN